MTLRWVPGWNGLTEPEAASYVAAVETADGEPLEFGVAKAINDFVLGCKNDGIWDAIKASCILAGAKTLNGALVPLVGTAPTNNNFVSGDYDRETGLVGDGSTKYLDSNRNNNADPQNNKHISTFVTYIGTGGTSPYLADSGSTGSSLLILRGSTGNHGFKNNADTIAGANNKTTGFVGSSRSSSGSFDFRSPSGPSTASISSETPHNGNLCVHRFGDSGTFGDSRVAFYSIGESLDLAALDTRVSALITAIGAAIP